MSYPECEAVMNRTSISHIVCLSSIASTNAASTNSSMGNGQMNKQYRSSARQFAVLTGIAVALAANVAAADVVQLSYSATSPGTVGSGANTALPTPGSHTFGNSHGSLSAAVYISGSGQSYEFYDDYVFTVTGSTANVLTSSINLGSFTGLENFQVRLYELAGNTPLPAFGSPAGGTLLQAWSTPINYTPGMTGLLAVIGEEVLDAGSYVLEVRGNVSGQFGGSYSGVMNLAPVPLPAAAWLLLSGLGGLGFLRGYSRNRS